MADGSDPATYRIVTLPSRGSGETVGYFDRWHAVVYLGDDKVGYGQGFTRRRAERRARRLADGHRRWTPAVEARETTYRPAGAAEPVAPSSRPAAET